jgi:two-component system, NarL family, invasion response regulator UvrY
MPVVLIIDDHPIIRRGIRQILEDKAGDIQVHEAGTVSDGLKKFREYDIDLVLLDISLPGRSGLDMIEDMKQLKSDAKILMISMYPEEQYAIRALKSGASGYLTKESAPDELLLAVDRIIKGGRYITQSLAEQIFDTLDTEGPVHRKLSNREFEVMIQIAKGKDIKKIAIALSLSEKTVSTYRSRILEKMNLLSNTDLVRYALRNKLIE